MHPALGLPEVVEAILSTYPDSTSFLYPCLFVNRLFSLEATRILWSRCGLGYRKYGSAPPPIDALARLVSLDIERAKFYVKFIQSLSFAAQTDYKKAHKDTSADEVRWHKLLRRIQFPALQHITLSGSPCSSWLNLPDSLLHYAQGSLKIIILKSGSILSDEFRMSLSAQSPNIKTLVLFIKQEIELESLNSIYEPEEWTPSSGGDYNYLRRNYTSLRSNPNERDKVSADVFANRLLANGHSLSSGGLIRFLNRMAHVETIKFKHGFDAQWSPQLFQALTEHPNLKTIGIFFLPDYFLDLLPRDTTKFPTLRELHTWMTAFTFKKIVPYIRHLLKFNLKILGVSTDIIITISLNLHSLTSITYQPPSISKDQLICIARGCPNLEIMRMIDTNDELIESANITDSTIREMTGLLPSLSMIWLPCAPIQLTNASLISLCTNCKNLIFCSLSINPDFEALCNQNDSLYSKLQAVSFVVPDQNRPMYSDANDLGRRLASKMPQLTGMNIFGGTKADRRLCEAFNDFIVSSQDRSVDSLVMEAWALMKTAASMRQAEGI